MKHMLYAVSSKTMPVRDALCIFLTFKFTSNCGQMRENTVIEL